VTSLVHGPDAAAAAIAASEALFGQGDLRSLDAATLASALRELPHAELPAGTPVVNGLVETGLVSSLGEARRAIAQGGVSVDGVKVQDEGAVIEGSLPGGVAVLRRGKKTLAGVFLRG
jgi:tyrosyl-tRNA synthetase